jgi:CheY-specific phosphatase CheX
MSSTVQLSNVCEFMKQHVVEVFKTMIFMEVAALADHKPPPHAERVSGSVGFAGDRVTGALYLHLSAAFAKRAAAAMLGLEAGEDIEDVAVNDVVGEVTNMLAGGLKSWLCDAGALCAMSTPGIIRGASFDVEVVPEVRREWLVFGQDGERIVVEIHLKMD